MSDWLVEQKEGWLLRLYIRPNSSANEVTGLHGDRIKVKIKSPPQDGEANLELKEYVGSLLGIAKSKVSILRGESSRQKDLLIDLPYQNIFSIFSKLLQAGE